MAISIDAMLAVLLFIGLITYLAIDPVSEIPLTNPKVGVNQMVDDAMSTMESTGFIMESVESGDAAAINAKLQGLLPNTIDYNLVMTQYQSNLDLETTTCRTGQDFDSCFPDKGTEFFTIGTARPTDKEIYHGKKIFIKKEPGDCSLEGGFKEEKKKWFSMLFQGIPDDNFVLSSSVESPPGTPITELSCDQEALVRLSLTRNTNERVPVDIIFAASKNASMAECAIAAGNQFYTYNESNITRADFGKATEFTVSSAGAIDLVLSWASCSTNCPEFYVTSPGTTSYGSGQGTTEQNSQECNEKSGSPAGKAFYYNNRTYLDYLALGSALSETGTWELFVKNPDGISYDVEAKYIDNNHFDEFASPTYIQEWNEPISKVDIAKWMITSFATRADWNVSSSDSSMRDRYAYAEIGQAKKNPVGEGSSIQPGSGMRYAKDLSPPFPSQMKNLDAAIDQIPAPSYSFALDETDLINDVLAGDEPGHTKFAIILGDSLDNPSGSFTIANAIADALAKGLYYYTIDLSEDNWGLGTCQNQDLLDLANQTGGQCYPASDEGALGVILDLIAREMGDESRVGTDSGSVTLTMTFPPDFNQSFLYNFSPAPDTWNGQTLKYLNKTITGIGWTPSFNLKVPCDFATCDTFFTQDKNVTMPASNTVLSYSIDGFPNQENWPVSDLNILPLLYTDLSIEYLGGHFYGKNDVTVEYRVSNIGYTSADLGLLNPAVYFYSGDSPLNACTSQNIGFDNLTDVLNAAYGTSQDAGTNTTVEKMKSLSESGYLCLWLNKGQDIRDCGENNWIVVNCEIPITYIYVLDYWMWEK